MIWAYMMHRIRSGKWLHFCNNAYLDDTKDRYDFGIRVWIDIEIFICQFLTMAIRQDVCI